MNFEAVKEDAIECWLFPDLANSPKKNIDYIFDEVRKECEELSQGYIWHKDKFQIFKPMPGDNHNDLPPHFYSITYFEDNVEDEWFIVYLLFEISKNHQGLVIQIQDNDGQFLLIEAADALPAWAIPDNTENRVFIYNGELHLIPPEIIRISENATIQKSIDCVRTKTQLTKASQPIQDILISRIEKFKNTLEECLHRSVVRIPVEMGALLKLQPHLIAQSVNAYCNHDATDAKYCRSIKPSCCIDVTVTFTKCLYAMLNHCKSIANPYWKIPTMSSPEHKKCSLGLKIACGFEILLRKASQDTFATNQWKLFLDSLRKNGYFKDNIEGSQLYSKLLEAAKEYFIANECSNIGSYVGNEIKTLIESDMCKNECERLKQHGDELIEDSEDWLNVKPEQLNELLNARYGKQTKFTSKDIVTPHTVTNELAKFLNKTSDFEGVEVMHGEDKPLETLSDDKIDFDYGQFTDTVKNILDLVVPEDNWNLDSGTDLSEYGSDSEFGPDVMQNELTKRMDEELSQTTLASSFLSKGENIDITKNTYINIVQSMKEEMGSSGPSSNVLKGIGIGKSMIQQLDSDDDMDFME